MKIRLLTIILLLPLYVYAEQDKSSETEYSTDIQNINDEFDEISNLSTFRKEIEKCLDDNHRLVNIVNKDISRQFNHLDQVNHRINVFIGILTVILTIITIIVTITLNKQNKRVESNEKKVDQEIEEIRKLRIKADQDCMDIAASAKKTVEDITHNAQQTLQKATSNVTQQIEELSKFRDQTQTEAEKNITNITEEFEKKHQEISIAFEKLKESLQEVDELKKQLQEHSINELVRNSPINTSVAGEEDQNTEKQKTAQQEKAHELLEKIDTSKSEDEMTSNDWFFRGFDAQSKKEFIDACFYYKKATETDPENSSAYNNWGTTLFEMGHGKKDLDLLHESIEKYTRAANLKPDNPDIFYNRGNVYHTLGVLKEDYSLMLEANEDYKRALSLNPDNAKLYNNWGNLYSEMWVLRKDDHLIEKAFERYSQSIAINNNYLAYMNWGTRLLKYARDTEKLNDQETIKDIFSLFNKAHEQGIPGAAYNIGCLYSLTGDIDEAYKWLTKNAFSYSPEKIEVYMNDPDLENVRKDARFPKLIKDLTERHMLLEQLAKNQEDSLLES